MVRSQPRHARCAERSATNPTDREAHRGIPAGNARRPGAETPRPGDTMNRQPVSSSNLHSVGCDHGSAALEIRFHSGGVDQYPGVDPSTHAALLAAPSKGRFFHAYIKGRPFRRIR